MARDKDMAAYLNLVMDILTSFEKFELVKIQPIENNYVDTLSKIVSSEDSDLLMVVPIEHLA